MPSPVKFGCNAWDLNRAAEKHLGFKNVWPQDPNDVRNLILNLLELVAEGYEVEVNVVRTSPTTEEDVAMFSVEISPIRSSPHGRVWVGDESRMEAEEFRRVMRELQEMILSH
jgi:hypothetical protein